MAFSIISKPFLRATAKYSWLEVWLGLIGLLLQIFVPGACLFMLLIWGPCLIISEIRKERAEADFLRRNAGYLKAHRSL